MVMRRPLIAWETAVTSEGGVLRYQKLQKLRGADRRGVAPAAMCPPTKKNVMRKIDGRKMMCVRL